MRQKKSSSGSKKNVYEERILNSLNMIVRQELTDARLSFATLTKVVLNNDFSLAEVYWDSYDPGKRDGIKKALSSASKRMRSLLAQNLKVKAVPEIKFIYDTQFEDESHITEILANESKEGKKY